MTAVSQDPRLQRAQAARETTAEELTARAAALTKGQKLNNFSYPKHDAVDGIRSVRSEHLGSPSTEQVQALAAAHNTNPGGSFVSAEAPLKGLKVIDLSESKTIRLSVRGRSEE